MTVRRPVTELKDVTTVTVTLPIDDRVFETLPLLQIDIQVHSQQTLGAYHLDQYFENTARQI